MDSIFPLSSVLKKGGQSATTKMAETLSALKAEIESVGSSISRAKKDIADKDEAKKVTGPLVTKLLALKEKFAGMNNGIGVDGKTHGEKGKKEKKKEGDAQANQVASAENAAKKAAKKAEKAAKKAAHKAGLKTGAAAAPTATATAPVAAAATATAATAAAAAAPSKPASGAPRIMDLSKFKLSPLQLVSNPNAASMRDRPVVALAVACLTDIDVDLSVTADHRVPAPMMGTAEGGGVIVGDLAIARYLLDAVAAGGNVLEAASATQTAEQNAWVEYAQSLTRIDAEQAVKGIAMTLEHALSKRTYVCGHKISLADVALFAALGFPCALEDKIRVATALEEFPIATRWTAMMAAHPALKRATQLAVGASGATDAEVRFTEETLEPLETGMNLLEGAIPGQVVTRFPPEPSGYLHVGHAKACLLNDYYARRYKGRMIVRFDDTNPSKEKEEYQKSIVEDLKTLGVKNDVLVYTSDYIGAIQKYALRMIEKGQAYMDDTPQEQMKEERANRVESKHRNQVPAEAKALFEEMCSGSEEGGRWCLRAKIDMSSDNGTMRDPVLYRQNLTPHHRTGTTYKAYPTYDLACPIVDSLEGVTHALRTTEYNDRDEQYQHLLKTLGLRRVRIHSFCRMNFQYTVLSKRKLTWFVEQNLVSGWNDARFPTVRGVLRRGVSIPALKKYIYSQGASRRVVNMVWNSFWAENKKELDVTARRFMAVDANANATLTITNFEDSGETYVSTSLHPKDPSMGNRPLKLSSKVLLEQGDAQDCAEGENIVLLRWGVIKITKKSEDSKTLEGEVVPDGDFKACKRKLSWMIASGGCATTLTEFDHLVTKEKLEEGDKFEDFVNPNTIATTSAIGDPCLKTLQEGDVIQLERRGFYRVDRPYLGKDKPCVLYMIPDGKTKSMSGMVGKLAHH
eukprot:CAMPEP_0172361408 /NCGR_PEP_ID=MMETSP1060-20121228/5242_1 /TAXON_ID=37318 /ORGANISM="Pseudo-nitzschia pungens, Strain cf. cingulata" /LENGTH=912 /DNA_ID=CAMNT_0013083653 /DNA_START=85 /DNA_END=2823 /DNA_ORIENTATION=-